MFRCAATVEELNHLGKKCGNSGLFFRFIPAIQVRRSQRIGRRNIAFRRAGREVIHELAMAVGAKPALNPADVSRRQWQFG